jgi:hypothetical protein
MKTELQLSFKNKFIVKMSVLYFKADFVKRVQLISAGHAWQQPNINTVGLAYPVPCPIQLHVTSLLSYLKNSSLNGCN